MKIVVCIKRVPDTAARIRVAADGRGIDPAGVEWVVSPYDEYAVEEALRIKEKRPDTEVIACTLGPAEAAKDLRTCLAMGADRAIHLVDDAAAARDTWGTARALADVITAEGAGLALFGRQSVDQDCAAVGPFVAALLGWPVITFVRKLELREKDLLAHRDIEGAVEVIEAALPAVLTAEKGLNEPRFPSLKGIMAAKKKPLESRPAPAVPPRVAVRVLEPPPARPPGRIVGQGVEAIPALLKALREEAKAL